MAKPSGPCSRSRDPPCSLAIRSAIARPRPQWPGSPRAGSRRWKGWRARPQASSGMPAPRSHTWISKPCPSGGADSGAHPGGVQGRSTRRRGGWPWARALSSRLATARARAVGRTMRSSGGRSSASGSSTPAAASASRCSSGTSTAGSAASAPANTRNWRVMRSSATRSASARASSPAPIGASAARARRSRRRVSGLRRSWPMPASIVERSWLAACSRSTMALKRPVRARTARVPRAGRAAGRASRPTSARAASSWRRGRCTSSAR